MENVMVPEVISSLAASIVTSAALAVIVSVFLGETSPFKRLVRLFRSRPYVSILALSASTGGVVLIGVLYILISVYGTNSAGLPIVGSKCTDKGTFITDVTIPDDTIIERSQGFTKQWLVRNPPGGCTWSQDYHLVFVTGVLM